MNEWYFKVIEYADTAIPDMQTKQLNNMIMHLKGGGEFQDNCFYTECSTCASFSYAWREIETSHSVLDNEGI